MNKQKSTVMRNMKKLKLKHNTIYSHSKGNHTHLTNCTVIKCAQDILCTVHSKLQNADERIQRLNKWRQHVHELKGSLNPGKCQYFPNWSMGSMPINISEIYFIYKLILEFLWEATVPALVKTILTKKKNCHIGY